MGPSSVAGRGFASALASGGASAQGGARNTSVATPPAHSPPTIRESANLPPAFRIQLDPTRNLVAYVRTNRIEFLPMNESGSHPVSAPLGAVPDHDHICFIFRVDAVRTRGHNRNRRRPMPAQVIFGDFDPAALYGSGSD